jgi:hypothetical protein
LFIKDFTTKSEEFDSEIWKVFGGILLGNRM